MRFGLSDNLIANLHQIFQKYDAIEQVLIYGSRAKGNYKEGSDIDLAFKGERFTLQILSSISEEIDLLNSPYLFDLSIYHLIDNEEFISHIDRVGQEFYTKKSNE